MKIALPTRNEVIDDHFGHCEYFTVVSIDQQMITSTERIESPATCGCKSDIAQVLAQQGVTVMLAGNMGQGALKVLNNNGIEVIRGCSGNITTVLQQWLNGALTDNNQTCSTHEHTCQH